VTADDAADSKGPISRTEQTSYFSLRASSDRAARRYARVGDVSFVLAMVAVVALGAIVATRLI
jgi:hypothetical protein